MGFYLAMSSQTGLQWPALGVLVLSTLFGLYGDGGLSDQIVTMVRKPQHTVTVWPCVAGNCAKHLGSCLIDADCRQTLACCNKCIVEETDARIPACSYICEMTHGYQNEVFENMIKCFMENQCMSHYPRDGICKGEDKDGVQSITSLDQVRGDWWVVRGLNCGYGDYPGGYDGYPCQHERFEELPSGQWINNVTYCGGKNDECVSEMIVTIANISMPKPGVVRHDYTDAPLSPQVENWRILSWPDQGDYLFMLWCGQLPILEYNGGIVLSRKRNENDMPQKYHEEFRRLAAKFGIDYDKDLCINNNDLCPF